ncbi:5-carboxymethyl-2-hydroxymuconate isomerase, partial [Pseudomonas sp. FW306-2-11AA]
MKLCTYQSAQGSRVGVVADGRLFDGGVDGSMIDVIRDWPAAKAKLETATKAGGGLALDSVRLLAPVPRPGKIFAIGLNYA